MNREEERRKAEEEAKRREDEERMAAEKEFMEKFRSTSRLSSDRSLNIIPSGASSFADSESELDNKKRLRDKDSPETKKKKNKKKKGEEIESGEDEEEEDALYNLECILEKMKIWVTQPGVAGKIYKTQGEKFNTYLNRMQAELHRARLERAVKDTRIEERSAFEDILRTTVKEEMGKVKMASPTTSKPASFAEVTKQSISVIPPVSGVKGPIKQAPKQVIVRHAEKESEEITATLKRLVKPTEINVRRLVKIRNGVIVEADNEESVENLMKQEVLVNAGLKVERPTKKKPIIKVFDVSSDLTDEGIKEQVYVKNMRESQITEDEFKQEFEVRRKYKDVRSGGKKSNIIVECSSRVRNYLRERERIFIEWESCKVQDYVDVTRCYKCQRYGHVAKYCSSQSSCSHCAGEHDYKECPDKEKNEKVSCGNCKRDKRERYDHSVGSKKCPAYEIAVKRLNEKIDYGI